MKKYDSNGNLIAVGYLVHNPNFIPKGEYKETELDRQKKPIEVKGRGVRRYNDNVVAVTESVYNKL